MNIKINGNNITVTEAMKEIVNDKLSFLDKFVDETVNVHITNVRSMSKISIVFVYNNKVVKLEESNHDFYTAIDKLVTRLKSKMSKLHSLKVKQNQDHANALKYIPNIDSEIEESKIVKRKQATLEKMTEIEAIEELEKNEYQSYIFINTDNGNKVSMIYLRNDGNYGILVCD